MMGIFSFISSHCIRPAFVLTQSVKTTDTSTMPSKMGIQ